MSDLSTFTINLTSAGDEGASFRLQRRPGEIQHAHIIQEESELTVKADLFSVLHGTYTPGGDAASLIVIDFLFAGSDSRRKRFREAVIDVHFALEDKQPGDDADPVVDKIAPSGKFKMDPSTQQISTTLSTNATVSGGSGPVTLGIGGGWEKTRSIDEEEWAVMSGYPRVEGRLSGSCNAARWTLRENEQQKHGIPSILRTAILLVPKSTQKFRAFVYIETKVNVLSAAQQRLKKFIGGKAVDPVYFDEEDRRKPFGPQPTNVDSNNLSVCDLGKLRYDGLDGPSLAVGVTGAIDLSSQPPKTRSPLSPTSRLPPAPAAGLEPAPPLSELELPEIVRRLQILESRNRHLEERVIFQEKRNILLEERVLLLEKGRLGLGGGVGGD